MHKFAGLSVGQILKQKRTELGYSFIDIAERTKIREANIELLESERYSELTSEVYVKGMLSSYAKALGIDPTFILRLYKREQLTTSQATITKRPRINWNKKKLIPLATAAVIFTAFMLYIFLQVQASLSFPTFTLSSPLEIEVTLPRSEVVWETKADRIRIIGTTATSNTVTVNSIPLKLSPVGEFSSELLPLASISTKIKFTVTNQFGRSSELVISIKRVLE